MNSKEILEDVYNAKTHNQGRLQMYNLVPFIRMDEIEKITRNPKLRDQLLHLKSIIPTTTTNKETISVEKFLTTLNENGYFLNEGGLIKPRESETDPTISIFNKIRVPLVSLQSLATAIGPTVIPLVTGAVTASYTANKLDYGMNRSTGASVAASLLAAFATHKASQFVVQTYASAKEKIAQSTPEHWWQVTAGAASVLHAGVAGISYVPDVTALQSILPTITQVEGVMTAATVLGLGYNLYKKMSTRSMQKKQEKLVSKLVKEIESNISKKAEESIISNFGTFSENFIHLGSKRPKLLLKNLNSLRPGLDILTDALQKLNVWRVEDSIKRSLFQIYKWTLLFMSSPENNTLKSVVQIVQELLRNKFHIYDITYSKTIGILEKEKITDLDAENVSEAARSTPSFQQSDFTLSTPRVIQSSFSTHTTPSVPPSVLQTPAPAPAQRRIVFSTHTTPSVLPTPMPAPPAPRRRILYSSSKTK